MFESHVRPRARRTSPLDAWLRIALAAFVLATYVILAFGSGVARADDGSSASGNDSGPSAKTSQQSGSDGSGPGATSGTQSSTTEHSDAAPDTTSTPAQHSVGHHVPSRKDDPDAQDHTATVITKAAEPTPVTVVEDVTPPPVVVAHASKRATQSTKVPASTDADPPDVDIMPRVRNRESTVDPTVQTAPAIAPLAVVKPITPVSTIQPNLGLQFTGLVADVGTITVSAVHTVATTVAHAFGPSSFLGVPYLLATTVANAAAAVGRGLVGAPTVQSAAGQFPVTYGLLDGSAFFDPTKPPAGANDPSIFVTPEHPLPIILINGTTATQGANWSVGAPVLANAGYKVYTFNYGNTTADPNFPIQSVADIRQSGLELAAEVDEVLAATHAPKVILIGHSQGGGILPIYYINDLGGAAKVSQLIGISPSNHGTDFDQLAGIFSIPILGPLAVGISNALGPALYQQTVGSSFQQEVYGNGDTRPGVLYTTIASANDEIVTPFTQQALTGSNVTNVVLQDSYPGQVLGHANIFTSPQAFALVLDALASNPAANPLPKPTTVAA